MNASLIVDPKAVLRLEEEVSRANLTLARHEQIKEFRLIDAEWSIVRGEMTPKLSLKRKVIMESLSDLIGEIYKN
ncbi:MAG: hypothetical protein JNM63_18230 [Spirochaetia bacterium]|nr:hypothetical protein [Spirochaetia bacterium]